MKEISQINSFTVKQQKQFGGIADRFGRDFTNHYAVFAPDGSELFVAAEHVKDLKQEAVRKLYKKNRPFEIEMHDEKDKLVLKVIRKHHNKHFHSVEIFDPQNTKIAKLDRVLKLTKRQYALTAHGFEGTFLVTGSLADHYRFQITQGEKRVGEIKKVKDPLFKKGNKCDDEFIISFAQALDARLKLIFLGSLFLIDFVYFE